MTTQLRYAPSCFDARTLFQGGERFGEDELGDALPLSGHETEWRQQPEATDVPNQAQRHVDDLGRESLGRPLSERSQTAERGSLLVYVDFRCRIVIDEP